MTANNPRGPSRRAVLGSGAALLASLAGCSGLVGTEPADTRTPPHRSSPPSETASSGPAERSSPARTPTATARPVGPVHLQVTGDLWPVVGYLARAWNANRSPEGGGIWSGAAEALDAEARLADHFAAEHGIDPTGTRSDPPFGLLTSVAAPEPTARDLAAGRVDAGETDRGAVDRVASESEDWPDPVGHTVAREGQAFVVSPALTQAGVTRLTVAEIRDLYAGEVGSWAPVGGPDREPYVVAGPTGTPDPRIEREFFGARPMDGVDVRFGRHDGRAKIVEERDDAVAYLGVGAAADRFEAPAVAVDGTAHGVRDPGYPTTDPVAVYTRGPPDEREAAVVDALTSPVGRELVRGDPELIAVR
ncbi:type 2 periplasmic-binding domain-containing protein [Halosimplex halophilum]|uniref:hypothetical protein n=1 Tax=Halosimplex halophilum TaxID=2559572 RepID=UPI00107F2FA3|nr:hypothetical protein [Halosimplex halophilum]